MKPFLSVVFYALLPGSPLPAPAQGQRSGRSLQTAAFCGLCILSCIAHVIALHVLPVVFPMPTYSSYPTQHEAQQIANLDLSHCSDLVSSSASGLLADLIQFCISPDVKNFLFSKEKIELSHIANPYAAKNAVSGSIIRTGVDLDAQNLASDHLHSMHALFPVFQVNNLSFGFAVHEALYTPMKHWVGPETEPLMRFHSRFVRDDATQTLVFVLNIPGFDVVQLNYTRLVSTTSQTQVIARFHYEMFDQVIHDDNVSKADIIDCLQLLISGQEYRDCPTCSSPPQFCLCELRVTKAKHPYDMSAFHSNMGTRLGCFNGISRVAVYENKRVVFSGVQKSKIVNRAGVDLDLIESLRKWSLCSVQPEDNPREDFLLLDRHTADETGPQADTMDAEWSELLFGASTGRGNVGGCFDATRASFDNDEMTSALAFMEDVLQNTDDVQTGQPKESPPHESHITSQEDNRSAADTTVVGASHFATVHTSETEFQLLGTDNQVGSVQPSKNGGSKNSVGEAGTSSNGANSTNDNSDKELVKKLMAELRRERNRASAQRSNLRKKADQDAKKLEIKSNREKGVLLRSREKALREENVRLRKKLMQSK